MHARHLKWPDLACPGSCANAACPCRHLDSACASIHTANFSQPAAGICDSRHLCNTCHTQCARPWRSHQRDCMCRPGQDGLESRCSSERCSSSEKPAFPPLPRPLQPRHSFTLQASSGIGAATIRLNDVRVTAPGPNPKLLFTAPREGSPVLSCTQEDAMEPAGKSKDALQASDDEG